MNNQRSILIIIIAAVILTIIFFVWKKQNTPAKNQAINVLIRQLSNNNLSLEQIKLQKIYPSKPEVNQNLDSYYQAKIINKNGQVLYLTQIPKEYLISRFTYPQYQSVGLINKPNNEISLFLPVYPDSDKLVIEDESGNSLISVNLQNITDED